MISWYLILTPFAVTAMVLLFGVIGCVGMDPDTVVVADGPDGNPDPVATVEATPSIVAYWRLQEPAGQPVPGPAADQKGLHGGTYKTQQVTEDDDRHSPASASPPTLNLGVTPGMLDHGPPNTCIEVNGGYVEVPFSPTINPNSFSVVVLAQPEWDPTTFGLYYCLMESSAPIPKAGVGKRKGFAIYAGPADVTNPLSPYQWQVWFGDGSNFQRAQDADPRASTVEFSKSYLALTYDGTNLKLFVYYPGAPADPTSKQSDLDHIKAVDTTITFVPNLDDQPLFLGIGRNLFPTVTTGTPQDLMYPFFGKIQEVVMYDAAIPESTIASHILADFNV